MAAASKVRCAKSFARRRSRNPSDARREHKRGLALSSLKSLPERFRRNSKFQTFAVNSCARLSSTNDYRRYRRIFGDYETRLYGGSIVAEASTTRRRSFVGGKLVRDPIRY